ncbi:AEC family transporter [Rhodococcus sp. ACS1]|uniref:AEC family transporter n=1 Tax=Rhodococcus sp. ACS1 TaxID=2028570 RepID=UPI00117BA34A|nr:AEC family transporter [Rhodococcus sp. ACS1]
MNARDKQPARRSWRASGINRPIRRSASLGATLTRQCEAVRSAATRAKGILKTIGEEFNPPDWIRDLSSSVDLVGGESLIVWVFVMLDRTDPPTHGVAREVLRQMGLPPPGQHIVKKRFPHVALASILKLGVLPLAAGGIAAVLGVRGVALDSVIIICAVPTAPSAYILAARMGGNTQLMSSITAVQTILALATLPFVLTRLGS